MNLKKLLIDTKKVVFKVGTYAEREFNRFQQSQVEYKSNSSDLVSYVDKETEKKLITALLRLTPEASIIGEENTQIPKKTELTWIIDPIDGTTNFVHGVPLFALSVGLLYKNQLVLGIVYNPAAKEMFYATSETPAMLNNKRIYCSPNIRIEKSIVSIGISLAGKIQKATGNKKWFFENLPILMSKVRALRAIGSAALSMCWVAAGRLDVYYEKGLNSWDIAGAAVIVRQAGGKISDFSKKKDFLFKRELICAGKIHSQFYKMLKEHSLIMEKTNKY